MTTYPNHKVARAIALGAVFVAHDRAWTWRHGLRSSADQYCRLFTTRSAAAEHFLNSREGIEAMERRLRRGDTLSGQ